MIVDIYESISYAHFLIYSYISPLLFSSQTVYTIGYGSSGYSSSKSGKSCSSSKGSKGSGGYGSGDGGYGGGGSGDGGYGTAPVSKGSTFVL